MAMNKCSADVANLIHYIADKNIKQTEIILIKLYLIWISDGWEPTHNPTSFDPERKLFGPFSVLRDLKYSLDVGAVPNSEVSQLCCIIYPEFKATLDRYVFEYVTRGWNGYNLSKIQDSNNTHYYDWYSLGQRMWNLSYKMYLK